MRQQQLHVLLGAGADDPLEQAETSSLQGAQRGEDERPARRQRYLQRRLFLGATQWPDGVELRRRLLPWEVEGGGGLADLRVGRQALVQRLARRQAEALGVPGDHPRVRTHQQVVDLAAAPIEVLALRRIGVAPGHHRQRQARLAVDRQCAGDRHVR